MTFPNNPNRDERRKLSDRVGSKGWIFGGIIVVAVIVAVLALSWTGTNNRPSAASNAPAATNAAGAASQGAHPGAPAAPAGR